MYSINSTKLTGSQKNLAGVIYPTPRQIKEKKMNFLKQWLYKILNKDSISLEKEQVVREVPDIDQPDRAIRFTLYMANGGRVIETRRYDRKTDRSHQNLYIITPDQDFGKEIDKIVTMESLR